MRRSLTLIAAVVTFAARAAAAEVVPVPQFRSVELRGGGSVTVVPGPVQRVTIVEGSSQFTHMRVERDGQLRIDTCDERCPPVYRLRVEIQSPNVPEPGASVFFVLTKRADKVGLKIVDGMGKVVRELQAPAEAGLHQVNWDLTRLSLRLFGNRNVPFGELAAPGMYRVVLTVDGTELAQSLRVDADPHHAELGAPVRVEGDEVGQVALGQCHLGGVVQYGHAASLLDIESVY